MRLSTGRLVLAAVAAAAASLGAASLRATAQEPSYPNRPITMVVTLPAGGASDVLARAVAAAMARDLGKAVAVENRAGAGGHIGAESVAHAAADGYTILFGTNGTLGIGPALYKNLRELIDYARANPGKLSFASAGVGTASHLAGELFKEQAKIDILHVPYKGDGATFPDLLAGRVSMMMETIPTALPMVKSGGMRAIGVTVKDRSSQAPDIPTLAESGLPDFDVSAWTGLFAPAGTPRPIVARLNAETVKIAQDKSYVGLIQAMGTEVASSSPEAFGQFVHDDVARWTEVIRRAGIPQIIN